MKPLNFIFLHLSLAFSCFGQDNVTIAGKVVDQNGQPLKEVKIRLLLTAEANHYTTTNKAGVFLLKNIKRNDSYIVGGEKDTYLSKTEIYYHDKKKSKDTAYLTFSLRQRSTAIIEISDIGEKDLGITIEEAIKKFKIDTTEALIQKEPPGIARGIESELGDSTIIFLQINRKPSFSQRGYKHILNEKVIGIGLAFTNCKTKRWGTGFVWSGLYNPYCKRVVY
jgi:hypothetical protein